MRILFDNCVPNTLLPIVAELGLLDISLSRDLGWDEYENGDLIDVATSNGFDIIVTTDRRFADMDNIGRQRLEGLAIGVIIFFWHNREDLMPYAEDIVSASKTIRKGRIVRIENKGL